MPALRGQGNADDPSTQYTVNAGGIMDETDMPYGREGEPWGDESKPQPERHGHTPGPWYNIGVYVTTSPTWPKGGGRRIAEPTGASQGEEFANAAPIHARLAKEKP